KKIDAQAVVNGENLGQVASQTLASMHAINEETTFTVLRPLLTLEKNDIVKKPKEYGTYETSTMPFEDCCTIFNPEAPKTRPALDKVLKFESNVDFDPMIDRALENIEIYATNAKDDSDAFDSLL